MDPRDFISLALRLSNSQNEADLRSAVSRAYYGAFHVARQFFFDVGLRWTRKESYAAEVHMKVRYCLSQAGEADALLASDQLWSLRDLRNQADYDLDSTRFKSAARVATAVRIAPEVVDAIQRCRVEPVFTEAGDRIRKYARDVLRINVEGEGPRHS
ncbi:MAG TPA: hypothetical protein VFI31_00195 [Pirellulales bacterium]|nr:hypothetical protein [Pirellulales bacterium]